MRELTRVRDTEVSTVRTPNWIGPLGYETCLFYKDKSSEVVQHYDTEVDALRGHIFWVNKILEWVKRGNVVGHIVEPPNRDEWVNWGEKV